MLNLICGPSGSGKSAEIVKLIRRDIEQEKRCYLLLPEQEAYISERDLPKKLPENAGLYFKIVNFSGLCEDVFQKFGGSANLLPDQTSRAVLMWETLRSLSGVLTQYDKTAKSDAALTDGMLGAVTELQNGGVGSEELEKVAASLPQDAPLAKKLNDLSRVSATYNLLMEERFGESLPDRFFHLAKTLQKHDFFSGANLYIDSFTDFTAPEYAILTELIRQCAAVTVGLCVNSLQTPAIHFRNVSETANRLKKCADKADSPTRFRFLTNEENCRPQALRVLERDLWRFDLAKEEKEKVPDKGEDCVSILAASNLYEESEAIALNILDLVQNGMHYGDIAVFVRDTEKYRGVLDAALERHGIPCFFSARTELSSKPLARLILSALRAINGYRMQDVIALVKTGLCGVSERDAALFEEYCETWHISGKRFLDSAWSMNPNGFDANTGDERAQEILETANAVRKAVILPLQMLEAELRGSKQLPDRCRAVYDYLLRIRLPANLSELAGQELALGQVREAGESLRLYDLVKDSLALLCRLLPDATVTAGELLSLFEIVFSHSDLGSVPGVHDCVLIGSAATARAEGVRAAFLPGLVEGEFPKSVQNSGLLSESDKKTLREHGLLRESDPDLESSRELFYVYRAVTKPLEKLYLSFSLLGSKGEQNTPSLALRRVCFLLDRKPKDFDFSPILQYFAENTAKNDANSYQAAPLGSGVSLFLSKSKINAFVKCPYSYYSQYVLKLRDQKESLPTPKDDGIFIHYIFEKFLKQATENGELRLPGEKAELETIVGKLVLDYLQEACPIPLSEMDARLLHLYARLQTLSVAMLQDMIEELKSNTFRPALFEASLGKEVPAVKLPLPNGSEVQLSGKIDRIDYYPVGEKTFVRIIDYKTGSPKFSQKDAENGKDVQLVLYLNAATQADSDRFVPAGAYYLSPDKAGDAVVCRKSGFTLDDADLPDAESGNKKEKMTKAEIEAMIERVLEKIREVSEQILSGNAEKTPSESACQYCIVRKNCNLAKQKSFKK